MANLHVMVGLPASGKSTKAREMSRLQDAVDLSSDEIGKELFGDYVSNGDETFRELYNRAEKYLKLGKDVIIDATNLSLKRRKATVERFRKKADKLIAHYFNTPLEICLDRNKERDRQVPEKVIDMMYRSATIPTQEEGWDEVIIHHYDNYIWSEQREELEKIISNPCEYTQLMGLELFTLSKAFRDIYNFAQDNPYHSLSVSRHTYFVWEHILNNYKGLGKLVMLWTALLHDTGKRYTKEYKTLEDGTVSRYANFIGHENVSAQLACTFLKDLGYDDYFVIDVVMLVQNHMKLLHIGDSDKGLRKLREFVGEDQYKMLELFREADTSAK